jgi:hypothetical protein
MPRFYFDSRDNGTFIEDNIGLIFQALKPRSGRSH